jgi:3-hydroxyisobutyrate dehydrogenase-like beta-hydroxyacid dehydrogenase
MAERLAGSGNDVIAFDLDPNAMSPVVEAGAEPADDVMDLARRSDVVMVSLPSIEASWAVAEQVGSVARDGGRAKVFVEMSTIGKRSAQQQSRMLESHGVKMLDAPVSGGGEGARRGALTIMASGAPDTYALALPALERIGKRIYFIGERPGHAQVMKLMNNICALGQIALALEACSYGMKSGLDPQAMMEVWNVSSGRSGASRFVVPEVLSGRYRAGASMEIAYKDVALCVDEAEHEGVPMWLGASIAQLWRHGLMHVGGDADMSHLADLFESWADVSMRDSD